ncbi:MAG: hypothetical protein CSA40_00615 [Flavobacteriales bacterium]|nr:MAG: hypothetical protein CSA40_00615 [Flavobacteriales bacterium]
MKLITSVLLLFVLTMAQANVIDELRSKFPYIEVEDIDDYLDELDPLNSAEAKVYKGALYMLKSKNAGMPIKKYKFFKTGKKLINAACNEKPNSIEIRYIRLVFQHQIPAFLGYNSNKEEDMTLFLKNYEDCVLKPGTKLRFVKNMLQLENLAPKHQQQLKLLL